MSAPHVGRFKALTAACGAVGAILFFAGLAVGDAQRATFWLVATQGAKLLAVGGAIAAATAFERGDYLRRAWLLIAANYTLITLNVFLFGGSGPGSRLGDQLDDWFVLVANLVAIVGTIQLARAWRVAGLDHATTPLQRRLITGGAIVVALALAGAPLASFVRAELYQPSLHAVVGIVVSAADGICFALIAPLVLTALGLRGGVLWWPWALYAGASFAWIVFDALLVARGVLAGHTTPTPLLVSTVQSIRVLACLCSGAAGWAQRWANS